MYNTAAGQVRNTVSVCTVRRNQRDNARVELLFDLVETLVRVTST